MHHYASQLVDLLPSACRRVDGASHHLFYLRIFRRSEVPGERIGLWTRGRHFLLHHNDVDLAPHYCGRFNPIADRSFVVPLQGKTTQVA